MLLEIFAGVVSGAISAMIAIRISNNYDISNNIQFIISAFVAAVTVSGKAMGKGIANKYSTGIVHLVGIIINRFYN